MKTLVIYYSYTGNTKKIAEDFALKESADIEEIKEIKRPGKFKAYSAGCFAAIKGKAWPIMPLEKDLNSYERIALFAPIWAGGPAPEMNAVLNTLPGGKKVLVKAVSASGASSCKARIEKLVAERGCELESFEDLKV